MPEENKKPVCQNCGSKANCFCRERYEWWSRFLDYSILCPHCGYHETQTKHGGYVFFIWGIHLPTTCPFCDKPPGEHARGAKFEELKAGLRSTKEDVFHPDNDALICSECDRGEVICSYFGEMGTAGFHTWEHRCTNPECDFFRAFSAWNEDLDAKQKLGPGKDGGCPGPHK